MNKANYTTFTVLVYLHVVCRHAVCVSATFLKVETKTDVSSFVERCERIVLYICGGLSIPMALGYSLLVVLSHSVVSTSFLNK